MTIIINIIQNRVGDNNFIIKKSMWVVICFYATIDLRHGSQPWVSFLNDMVIYNYMHTWWIVNLPHTLSYHHWVKLLHRSNLPTRLASHLGGILLHAYENG